MKIQRRSFLTLLGGAAAAWPLGAGAQQQAMPVIGFLTNESFDGWEERLRTFREGLSETGFAEGRNLSIEFHQAEGDADRLLALTRQLVQRRVNVIVTNGIATLAAKAATSTIPIVFATGADPVEVGMVASLNRPGGNLTGASGMNDSLGPKRLELLHETLPAVTDIGVLLNPPNGSNEFQLRDLQEAAGILGLRLHTVNASGEQDFGAVFETLARMGVGALVIATAPVFNSNSNGNKLAALSVRHSIPTIYSREFATRGGLMGLGSNPTEQFHWLGVYTGRILKGERPADLPIYRATKIQLTINMKTAKALGLSFPTALLVRADEVIE